jgi:anti-sigma factor RsiW
MTGRASAAEALAETLAYVDNCLAPAARRAFEARLGGDAELRRNVARWQAQNREIRCAFGAPGREALDLGRATNENGVRRLSEPARRADGAPRSFGQTRGAPSSTLPAAHWRWSPFSSAPRRPARGLVGLATLAAALLFAAAPGLGPQPPAALLSAGLAAASALSALPVEFAAGDGVGFAIRLGPRLARAPPTPPGLRLLGARLAPGAEAAAALYVYEDGRGERAALLVEPLDEVAPAPLQRGESGAFSAAAWTGAGYGFVAAATEPDDVDALSEVASTER